MKKLNEITKILSKITQHPLSKMRDYTPSEMDWEHNVELRKYSSHYSSAFPDRASFDKAYQEAPLRHLTDLEAKHMGNAYVGSMMGHNSKEEKVARAHDMMGHRRDVPRIENDNR